MLFGKRRKMHTNVNFANGISRKISQNAKITCCYLPAAAKKFKNKAWKSSQTALWNIILTLWLDLECKNFSRP